jgi:hypothetical protein
VNTNPDPTWPNWLADIYGPGQIGRERRTKALAEHADHKRQVEARLDANRGRGPGAEKPATAPLTAADFGVRAREYTREEMLRARRVLGIPEPGVDDAVEGEL